VGENSAAKKELSVKKIFVVGNATNPPSLPLLTFVWSRLNALLAHLHQPLSI
jgi:hypothetical protein